MSDPLRKVHKVFLFRLPHIMGKRSIKIEQYRAKLWRSKARPLSKHFHPKVPNNLLDQRRYFDIRYRIKINGSWYRENGTRYTMLTQAEIYEIAESIEWTIEEQECQNDTPAIAGC